MEKKTGVFQGAVRNKRKRDAFEEEEETAAAAVTRSRRRRRRIAFPDRRKERKAKVSVRKREISEEEEEDSSSNPDDGKQEESGCSEEYEADIWEGRVCLKLRMMVIGSLFLDLLLPLPLHLLLLFFVEKVP